MPVVKTAELTGPALDWAVAVAVKGGLGADGRPVDPPLIRPFVNTKGAAVYLTETKQRWGVWYRPSKDWDQGGPIIESLKGFEMKLWLSAPAATCCEAHLHNCAGDWIQFGPTPLIAAMRCYVASKLGDEVEIPAELEGL
jgi:hypothetical protein